MLGFIIVSFFADSIDVFLRLNKTPNCNNYIDEKVLVHISWVLWIAALIYWRHRIESIIIENEWKYLSSN